MKRIIVILALLSVLLGYGCNQKSDSNQLTESPFIGGTTALVLSFMENAPPEKVFDGGNDPFDISINIKNVGEYTIPTNELMITISGIKAEEFGKTESDFTKKLDVELKGQSKDSTGNIIPGGEEFIDFSELNHRDSVYGMLTLPIIAKACYLYGGTAMAKLCYRKNLRNTETGQCEVEGTKQVYNSAHPIQVSEFSEYVKGTDKIGFTFKMMKMGSGEVYKKDLSDCKNAAYEDKNKVYVIVETGEEGLICRGLREGPSSSEGYATLRNGQAIVSCDQPADVNYDYEKPVYISMEYRYEQAITKDIKILHAGE